MWSLSVNWHDTEMRYESLQNHVSPNKCPWNNNCPPPNKCPSRRPKIRQVPLLIKCLPSHSFTKRFPWIFGIWGKPVSIATLFVTCYASTLTVIPIHHCVKIIMLLSWHTWLPKGGKHSKPLLPPPQLSAFLPISTPLWNFKQAARC